MLPNSSLCIELLRLFSQSLIIGIGWYVVHLLTEKRDLQKSRRDLLSSATDSLSILVDSIHEQALKYHCSNRDTIQEVKIKLGLQDLAYRSASLNKIVEESLCEKTWSCITPFKKSITKSHFEDEHLHPLNEQDPQYELIAAEALTLKRSLMELKYSQFLLP